MSIVIYLIIAALGIVAIRLIIRRLKPTEIGKQARRLRDLFSEKEDWEGYLARLDERGQENAPSKDSDGSVSEEYQQRVAEAIEGIAGVKSILRRALEDRQRIYQAYQLERERLAAKFKTGEIPLDKYEASERRLQKKTELIEPDMRAIERLISAESSGEIQS